MVDWSLYVFTARTDIFEENMHQKGVPFIGLTVFLEKFLLTPDLFTLTYSQQWLFIDTIPLFLLILGPFSV